MKEGVVSNAVESPEADISVHVLGQLGLTRAGRSTVVLYACFLFSLSRCVHRPRWPSSILVQEAIPF